MSYVTVPPLLTPAQSGAMPDILGDILSGYTKSLQARYLKPTLEEGLQQAIATNKSAREKLKADQYLNALKKSNPLLGMTGPAGQIGALMYLQNQAGSPSQQSVTSLPASNSSTIPSISGFSTEAPENQKYPLTPEQIENYRNYYNGTSHQLPEQQKDTLSNVNPADLLLQSIHKSLLPKQSNYAPSLINKMQQEYEDIQNGFYPGTNRQRRFESKSIQDEYAQPYREKLGRLKPGEHYVYDPDTNEKIAVQRPYTPKEKDTIVGRTFFDKVFPIVNNGFKDFTGKGSATNFVNYADNYGKDSVATKKIDDLLLARKLISAGVVNEAATLGAGKTNMTYKNLAKSFPNSDVNKWIQRYGDELKIPPEAFWKANVRFNNIIDAATKNAQSSVSAYKTEYFHPERYIKEENTLEQEQGNIPTLEEIRAEKERRRLARLNKGK